MNEQTPRESPPADDPFGNPSEPAEAKSPFDTPETPFDDQPTGPSSGCSTPLLIGCGVGIVLLGILLVVTLVNIPSIMGWVFESTGDLMTQELPDDIPAEERERLGRAFRDVARAAREERVDPERLLALQKEIREIQGKSPQELTREDVRELTEALEAAAQPPPADDASGADGDGDGGG